MSDTPLPSTAQALYDRALADLTRQRRVKEEFLNVYVAFEHPLSRKQPHTDADFERFYEDTDQDFRALYERIEANTDRLEERFEVDSYGIQNERWTLCENDGQILEQQGQLTYSYSFHCHKPFEEKDLAAVHWAVEQSIQDTGEIFSIVEAQRQTYYTYYQETPVHLPSLPAIPARRRPRP